MQACSQFTPSQCSLSDIDSEKSGSDLESEHEDGPPPTKTRKLDGAAKQNGPVSSLPQSTSLDVPFVNY